MNTLSRVFFHLGVDILKYFFIIKSMEIIYEYKKRVTAEQIENLVEDAMPGMHYWCDKIRYNKKFGSASEAILAKAVVGIHDSEEEKWVNLSLKKLLSGLSLTDNLNWEDYDMYDAETVIQRALYGKEVYA